MENVKTQTGIINANTACMYPSGEVSFKFVLEYSKYYNCHLVFVISLLIQFEWLTVSNY